MQAVHPHKGDLAVARRPLPPALLRIKCHHICVDSGGGVRDVHGATQSLAVSECAWDDGVITLMNGRISREKLKVVDKAGPEWL